MDGNKKNLNSLVSVLLVVSLFANAFLFHSNYELKGDIKSANRKVTKLEQDLGSTQDIIKQKDTKIQQLTSQLQTARTPKTVQVKTAQTKTAQTKTVSKPKQPTSYAVYITNTGSKYHRYGCQYLRQSCIKSDVNSARQRGLTPCSVCRP